MTTMEEFAVIEARLGWLEQYLRAKPITDDRVSMDGVIDALSCARALVAELASIGREPEGSSALATG